MSEVYYMINDIISSKIKELRTSLGLTQAEFAESINTTQAALSGYERGDRTPSLENLTNISQKYNVSIDWLLGRSDNKNIDFELKTYTDLIKLVLLIIDTSKISQKSYLNSNKLDIDGKQYSTLCLEIDDRQIVDFFKEWKELSSIREKSPSGNKLYNIWLKDIYERFNFPLENASQYFGDIIEVLSSN